MTAPVCYHLGRFLWVVSVCGCVGGYAGVRPCRVLSPAVVWASGWSALALLLTGFHGSRGAGVPLPSLMYIFYTLRPLPSSLFRLFVPSTKGYLSIHKPIRLRYFMLLPVFYALSRGPGVVWRGRCPLQGFAFSTTVRSAFTSVVFFLRFPSGRFHENAGSPQREGREVLPPAF